MTKKIGLIAGGGDLPLEVISGAKAQGYDVCVMSILNNPVSPKLVKQFNTPIAEFPFGQIGKIISWLVNQKCSHVVMAGNIKRPDFKHLKLDAKGITLLPRIVAAAAKGDDALLQALAVVIEQNGLQILSPQDLCSGLLMPSGSLGAIEPTPQDRTDLIKALQIATEIGRHDIGQGAVVCRGLVLAVEAQEGTDAVLRRVATLPETIRGTGLNRCGVLAKRLKPDQDGRTDLPTIGVKTIELAAAAGLSGIVLETGQAFVMDSKMVIKKADELGVFVFGWAETDGRV